MNAVILSGGFGTRLKPMTDTVPKPMLPVAGAPMIDYTVSHLWHFGIRTFVFTLGFKPEAVIDWAAGYRGAVCRFMVEDVPLGTLGGVKAAERFLDDTFLVLSGDAIEDVDLNAMLHKHLVSGALVTMAVTEVADTSAFGVPELDGFGKVTDYIEKPRRGEGKSNYANCGVYIVDKRALQFVPRYAKSDFSLDLFPALIPSGKLFAYIHDGYWRDAGTPQSYFEVNFDFMNGGFFPCAPNRRRMPLIAEPLSAPESLVAVSAQVTGGVYRSVVGAGAKVLKGAKLDACVVLDDAVASDAYAHCIIGKGFVLQQTQRVYAPVRQNPARFVKNIASNG